MFLRALRESSTRQEFYEERCAFGDDLLILVSRADVVCRTALILLIYSCPCRVQRSRKQLSLVQLAEEILRKAAFFFSGASIGSPLQNRMIASPANINW